MVELVVGLAVLVMLFGVIPALQVIQERKDARK
jgi:hypothetical protein